MKSYKCTHPDHNENETCIERAVGCNPYCICCMGHWAEEKIAMIEKFSFKDLKPGDNVTRMLAEIPMLLTIRSILDDIITCEVSPECEELYWTFDLETGMEVDDELEWGTKYGRSGSYLKKEKTIIQ